MNEPICCRTCGHLRILEYNDGYPDIHECHHEAFGNIEGVYLSIIDADPDTHFCALHTDQEAIKRMREVV